MTIANHVLLQRTTTTVNTSSITLSGIPASYTDLKIVISGRNNQSAYSDGFTLSVNSGSSYSTMELYQQNNSISSYGPRTGSTYLFLGHLPGASSTANTFGNHEIYIANYTSTGIKTVSIDGTTENNGFQAYQVLYAGTITNGTAINSITIDSLGYNFVAGSSFSLYGIANASTTPAAAPKADGGDIIKTDGTYWYHAFLSTGSFKPQVNLTADLLVVGGGGGGASDGGGGGAGGLLGFTSQALASTTTYACTVGAGGAPTTTWTSNGAPNTAVNGNDSQFGSLTLVKGGGGGASFQSNQVGATGGSGGGGGINAVNGTSGFTSGQGTAGGSGTNDGTTTPRGGGGGGGASVAGSNGGASVNGGAGGNGSSAYSSWGSATGLGQNVSSTYYFAGGGGGGVIVGTGGAGGYGGGGAGQSTSGGNYVGASGTAATGGGGAGSGYNNGITAGGSGGSGVIIIRYPV